MNTPGTPHEIHALSGAYAVDALDDAERARFEAHLAVCADCQAEVASLREATALLTDLTATEPPASLRGAVLDGIKNVRPLPPIGPEPEAAAEPAPEPGDELGDELAARRRPRWTRALVAAAAVIAVAGGGTVVWQQVQDSPASQPTSAADRIIGAGDVERTSTDLPGGASATIYRSASLNQAALVARDMPAAPAGHVYQLWFQKDGQMVPAGLMGDGANQAVVLDGSADDATAVGITVEPTGGSEHPTTAPVAVFPLETT